MYSAARAASRQLPPDVVRGRGGPDLDLRTDGEHEHRCNQRSASRTLPRHCPNVEAPQPVRSVVGQMSGKTTTAPRSLPLTWQDASDPLHGGKVHVQRYAGRSSARRLIVAVVLELAWPGFGDRGRIGGLRRVPAGRLLLLSVCRQGLVPARRGARIGRRSVLVGCVLQMLFAGVYAITALGGEPLEASFVFFLLGFLALFIGGLAWGTSLLRSGASMAGGGFLATAVAGLLAMLLGMDPWHDVFLLSSYAAWSLVARGFDAIPTRRGAPSRSRRQRRLTSSRPVAEEFRSVRHSGIRETSCRAGVWPDSRRRHVHDASLHGVRMTTAIRCAEGFSIDLQRPTAVTWFERRGGQCATQANPYTQSRWVEAGVSHATLNHPPASSASARLQS